MKLHGFDWALAMVIAGAGCAAVHVALRRTLRNAIACQQLAAEQQLAALAATVRALQARVAELHRNALPAQDIETIAAAAEGAAVATLQPPAPQTLAIITAAATAFLGSGARIRSARPLPAGTGNVSSWSQQGRVIVQTSHDLRARD